jgi:hypothetical protein
MLSLSLPVRSKQYAGSLDVSSNASVFMRLQKLFTTLYSGAMVRTLTRLSQEILETPLATCPTHLLIAVFVASSASTFSSDNDVDRICFTGIQRLMACRIGGCPEQQNGVACGLAGAQASSRPNLNMQRSVQCGESNIENSVGAPRER